MNVATMNIEICTASVQSVHNAVKGGAQRVELCCRLETGGLTPPMEWIDECKRFNLECRVLIRCREGNFVYSDAEYRQMLDEIAQCKAHGADAVVIGFLHEDGTIDVEKTREATQLARPMSVTFHRAFDECANPEKALEEIISCGCDKLLTSGHEPTAEQGLEMLKKLVEQAHGRISILAGSGVSSKNVKRIRQYTGVTELHGSCKRTVNGITDTDPDEVSALIKNYED